MSVPPGSLRSPLEGALSNEGKEPKMALDERKRTELAENLERYVDPRTVELLMEALSAADLANLATKQDLQALDHKVDLVEQRLIAEMHRFGRNQLLGLAAVIAVFNTGLFAVQAALS